ncbi:thiamine pyrophosphate-dependent enzyme [Bacteroidota bacterium]
MLVGLRTDRKMSYCPGCGHQLGTSSLVNALEKLGLNPEDVIVVSDIGCCGLIDPLLSCHTIHGLHGRAAALAMGVAMGINNPEKKIIAVQGDGGATIGMQHLMEAARQNIDITLIVQNNMIYGMTGGQISGLTSGEFKEERMPEESSIPPYNICELAFRAGASYSCRIIAQSDCSDKLAEAIAARGFSLVEIHALCPSYVAKKYRDYIKYIPFKEETLRNEREPHTVHIKKSPSLFESISKLDSAYSSGLEGRINITIAGSAGEGGQLAAKLLAMAGMASGLKSTKKGEYPITVGTGYSVAEVILSRDEINYTGIESPDVLIITSKEGLDKVKDQISEKSYIIVDSSLEIVGGREVIKENFRKLSGKKGATLTAIAYWLYQSGIIPVEALKAAAMIHKHSEFLLTYISNGDI